MKFGIWKFFVNKEPRHLSGFNRIIMNANVETQKSMVLEIYVLTGQFAYFLLFYSFRSTQKNLFDSVKKVFADKKNKL